MLLLTNATQAYAWGSTQAIPSFMGFAPDGDPVAELWMGTHTLGPSIVENAAGVPLPLAEVAGDLPFMMKVLAAGRPLSLQVHPGKSLAEAGFHAEEAAGKPITAFDRSFKDANHKPEMAYALTTFDTLVGFRPTAEILRILAAIDTPLAKDLGDDLRNRPGFRGIVRLVEKLLTEVPSAAEISDVVKSCAELVDSGLDIKRAYLTAVEVASYFPEDVGVVVSLLLNRLTLQPGEAAFLGPGVLHAHLSGMCIEVMASSDNVIRAGLTEKHIDPGGVVRCLNKGMSRVARVSPELWGFSTEVFSPDVDEFALSMTQVSRADPAGVALPEAGSRIILCTGGEVILRNERDEHLVLKRGASVFAGEKDGALRIIGVGEVAQTYEPARRNDSRMVYLV